MKLSKDQLERYDRDGFLLFPDLFSQQEVAVLQEEVERLKSVRAECVIREGEMDSPKILFKMDDPAWPTYSAPFRALSRVPRTLDVAKQVLRDDALYLHHYKLNVKAAIEGSMWQWHQDYMSWQMDGIEQPQLTTMLVMLQDTTELSGCLYFLPGTQEIGRIEPRLDTSTAYKLWAMPVDEMKRLLASHPDPIPMVGKAGTAAIFHCNLLHASGHNLSHRDRWAVYMCYNRCSNHARTVSTPRPEYVRGTDFSPLKQVREEAITAQASVAAE